MSDLFKDQHQEVRALEARAQNWDTVTLALFYWLQYVTWPNSKVKDWKMLSASLVRGFPKFMGKGNEHREGKG